MRRTSAAGLHVAAPLAAALLAACGAGAPAHDPISTPKAAALPNGLQSCAVLGDKQPGQRCRVYDTKAQAFAATDALTRRVLLYDRWLDLYQTPEGQMAVRNLTIPMAPADPESKWGDDQYLGYWDDWGDSAGFGEELQISASYRYAVTGTDADYQRLEHYVRSAVLQFEASGMDGYLARFHFAGVPAGTPIKNGRAMVVRDDPRMFDIDSAKVSEFPSYYSENGAKPSWFGHTSIDAYSGPMGGWPIAYQLIKDPELKQRMARHYSCFLKRLRIFKVINLSQNQPLQNELAKYLSTGILHLDPDDPDLTKLDQVWGFYLPQYNENSAATYPRDCPATLATDADAKEIIDVTQTGWDGKLLTLFTRMVDGNDQADSMDFAFFPGVRSGDAVMLLSYALAAYRMTGDASFLKWRDEVLVKQNNAEMVTRTTGAFVPPKPCRNYYRTGNVFTAHFSRILSEGDDSKRAFARDVWTRKFGGKEVAGLGNPLFAIMDAGLGGKNTADSTETLAELLEFGGAPGYLDTPRRNYAVDWSHNPPPGINASVAPKADVDFCNAPVNVMGVNIPVGDPTDPNILYADKALRLMDRPPDNWQWEKDPFRVVRIPGDAGRQQYFGLDLIELYWLARYYKLLPDAHVVLAWGPDEGTD